MSDQSQAEATRNIRVPTKRNLMSAVEQCWTIVPARVVVIRGLQDEVLIAVRGGACELCPTGVAEIRQAVGSLEVHCLDAAEGIVDVLHEFHLQSGVNRASNWFQEERLVLHRI